MLNSAVTTALSEGGGSYHYVARDVIGAAVGFSLTFNFRDCAYRIYEFFMNRAPFAPGPGFSPIVIRLVGAVIGAAAAGHFVYRIIE